MNSKIDSWWNILSEEWQKIFLKAIKVDNNPKTEDLLKILELNYTLTNVNLGLKNNTTEIMNICFYQCNYSFIYIISIR